ncbi:MAG: Helix-turn-helix domain [Actinomycetota bacterium]|nr:Helix-turn-helix domain [Actinomycetota bacterium]
MSRRPTEGSSLLQDVAARVAKRRRAAGLTQEELAERSNLHHTQISRIERGERAPGLLTLARLAEGLDTDMSELLRGLRLRR